MPTRILNVSYDTGLARRHALLHCAGHYVTSASKAGAAVSACLKTPYDIVILGESVPPGDRIGIASAAKQMGATVVALSSAAAPFPTADFVVDTSSGDRSLLDAVEAAAKARPQPKQTAIA